MFCVVKHLHEQIIAIYGPFDIESAADAWVKQQINRDSKSRVMKMARYSIRRLYRP